MPKDTSDFPDDLDAFFTSAELLYFKAANTNRNPARDMFPPLVDPEAYAKTSAANDRVEPAPIATDDDVADPDVAEVITADTVTVESVEAVPEVADAFADDPGVADAIVEDTVEDTAVAEVIVADDPVVADVIVDDIVEEIVEDTAVADLDTTTEHRTPLRTATKVLGGTLRLSVNIAQSLVTTAVVTGLILMFLFARELPNQETLLNYAPPVITQVRGTDGAVLDEFASVRRTYASFDEIPEVVRNAYISAEDKNFFSHSGFDPRAIAIAFYEAVTSGGERARGASTITQQLLKNVSLQGYPVVERKLREVVLSNRVEKLLSKEKILEIYLNEIFLGQNSYGVAAAARTYFNKPLDALAPHEAATLAAFAQAPTRLHPVRNHDRLLNRRNYVLREMYQNGFLTRAEFDAEVAFPIATVQTGAMASYASGLPARSYITDGIRREMSQTMGSAAFDADGLVVEASFDPAMQDIAARALRRALERHDRAQRLWRPTGLTIAPELLEDEATWRDALARTPIARDIKTVSPWRPAVVLSLSTSNARIGIEGIEEDSDGHWVQYRHTNWRWRQNPDGSKGSWASRMRHLVNVGDVVHVRAQLDSRGRFVRWSLRQVPELQGGFMAMDVNTGRVVAMQGGFSYEHSPFNRATQALRQPGSTFKPVVYAAALNAGYTPSTNVSDARVQIETEQGLWRPQNSDHRSIGRAPMRRGIELSRNLMTVHLAQDIGLGPIGALAEDFGLYEQMELNYANVLGTQETTLAQLVGAYATIANGGRRVLPTLVSQAYDRDGRLILGVGSNDIAAIAGDKVLDPDTAYQMTTMLRGVVQRGTARRAISLRVPVAGKTGTTDDAKDVWFIGYTSNLAAGCYIGYDTPRSLGYGATGASFCGPVFQEFMREAIKTYGGSAFAAPRG